MPWPTEPCAQGLNSLGPHVSPDLTLNSHIYKGWYDELQHWSA
jgi:hypothetical protein